ncbi:MAG: 30S ribosomal protein S7 [Prosthecochloris sp.]|uniref:Small ribosomal subunit protein uS7 n=1 Tax=Prosthecochloris aestuarii (strain DSM 271 / SK 413) TaxID=290512 RepID=RS7_PROA2|nr:MULTISPECIES: 30S ribosomal protein S7 [Prosthecochloris]B4S5N1.1 RecName: Full=Small ribosomal subunit protein uS7; AltName: Full=30S ribosomal protein S7 [Prosthecochloris aestuarii DSM 271]ACF47078.1 ribosomal protein S7 [Prosthecochloris aestuarii DSM 271]MCW8798062.1 30S ribosomal protein S7 [Prosthecochloris sp.]NEX11174.1 30S ribosomal protein S7 [Prosthecochloris sp.]RDD29397.1 30S ribosomal protein S7 [Prosthecochloris sp. ZM]
MGKKGVYAGVKADFRYGDESVTRLINTIMSDGKKSVAAKIVYEAMDIIDAKVEDADALEVFRKALGNVAPLVEVRSKRVGGATYQIPMEVKPSRREALAFRWIKQFATRRGGRGMAEKLAAELLDAANEQGASVKKRDEVHRMADANKAFAHFRF